MYNLPAANRIIPEDEQVTPGHHRSLPPRSMIVPMDPADEPSHEVTGDDGDPLLPGDLVRIADGIQDLYVKGLSVKTGWPHGVMWSDIGFNGGPEGSEFLYVPWDAVGVVTGLDYDGPGDMPLIRVTFPQGNAAWWPDHFARVK